ncbi:hypothetical protein BH23CHL4_BH23CHL4_01410 [soil metagenome]
MLVGWAGAAVCVGGGGCGGAEVAVLWAGVGEFGGAAVGSAMVSVAGALMVRVPEGAAVFVAVAATAVFVGT